MRPTAGLVVSLVLALSGELAAQIGEGECGFDRWLVKTLRDADTAKVSFTPVPTTVAELGRIPIPEVPYPAAARIPPHELRVYQVRAVLWEISAQDDRDWHLVLRDLHDSSATMLAEVPDSACVAASRHAAKYAAIRRRLRGMVQRATVVVEGVGFFDFIHSQRGRAPNGFELHPVLETAPDTTVGPGARRRRLGRSARAYPHPTGPSASGDSLNAARSR